MKLLLRNCTEFEYMPSDGTETDLNEDGEHTGEYRPVYGEPIEYTGNICAPSGHTNQTFYGEDIRYTHTLVMDDPEADIKETGLVRWKDHLYEITAVRPSLNGLSVALRRMTEDHGEPYEEPEEPVTGETGETGESGEG